MNIGDISEAKALAELTEHYKEVLEPFTDNSSYDYVVDDGESFHKIQVKHGFIENGSVICKTLRKTNMTSSGAKQSTYTSKEVDYFVIYCSGNDKTYKIPFEEAPKTQISLRLEPTRNNQPERVRWAENYEI